MVIAATPEAHLISKVEMARRMKTSRAALDRFLAPGNASVTLQTLTRAARAIGRDLRIELVCAVSPRVGPRFKEPPSNGRVKQDRAVDFAGKRAILLDSPTMAAFLLMLTIDGQNE